MFVYPWETKKEYHELLQRKIQAVVVCSRIRTGNWFIDYRYDPALDRGFQSDQEPSAASQFCVKQAAT